MSDFTIKIEGKYHSVGAIEWSEIPLLAIISGLNGSGKSQFLAMLGHGLGATGFADGMNPHHSNIVDHSYEGQISFRVRLFNQKEEIRTGIRSFYSAHDWRHISTDQIFSIEDVEKKISQARSGMSESSDILKIASQKLGLNNDEVRRLSDDELFSVIRPFELFRSMFTSGPNRENIVFLFLIYRYYERALKSLNWSEIDIRAFIGAEPWAAFNKILVDCKLPYMILPPEPLPPAGGFTPSKNIRYILEFKDIHSGEKVFSENFSSGEKVILGIALWRLGLEIESSQFSLLILDEPDAHLHPSLVAVFLQALDDIFIRSGKGRVIMTTHSPSTVALAPPGSLYEMVRSGEKRLVAIKDPDELIAKLTDGLVVVQKASRMVMLEGPTDPAFYKAVWDLLVSQNNALLNHSPNLLFMHSNSGKTGVKTLIPQLRAQGFNQFVGLVDSDNESNIIDGIYQLKRKGIENYLYDPIILFTALRQRSKGGDPIIQEVNIAAGNESTLSSQSADLLQKIVSYMAARIFPKLSEAAASLNKELEPLSDETADVSFTNALVLKYPAWMLSINDHVYQQACELVFPNIGRNNRENLLYAFRTIKLIPIEFQETFRAIQQS